MDSLRGREKERRNRIELNGRGRNEIKSQTDGGGKKRKENGAMQRKRGE